MPGPLPAHAGAELEVVKLEPTDASDGEQVLKPDLRRRSHLRA
jgi:hypothetical protein